MLARVIGRVRQAASVDEVVVATTTGVEDDAIESMCRAMSVACVRGSENDVLSRYCVAATAHKADAVIRITSDCPLIDPVVIDSVVTALHEPDVADYAANILGRRTYPRGLDTEALTAATLYRIDELADDAALREHVTLYVHRYPEQFRVRGVYAESDRSNLRWTVDTQDDYELVRRIYDALRSDSFCTADVMAVLAVNPEWARLNSHVEQKAV